MSMEAPPVPSAHPIKFRSCLRLCDLDSSLYKITAQQVEQLANSGPRRPNKTWTSDLIVKRYDGSEQEIIDQVSDIVAYAVATSPTPVCIITLGGSGTGKTFTIGQILVPIAHQLVSSNVPVAVEVPPSAQTTTSPKEGFSISTTMAIIEYPINGKPDIPIVGPFNLDVENISKVRTAWQQAQAIRASDATVKNTVSSRTVLEVRFERSGKRSPTTTVSIFDLPGKEDNNDKHSKWINMNYNELKEGLEKLRKLPSTSSPTVSASTSKIIRESRGYGHRSQLKNDKYRGVHTILGLLEKGALSFCIACVKLVNDEIRRSEATLDAAMNFTHIKIRVPVPVLETSKSGQLSTPSYKPVAEETKYRAMKQSRDYALQLLVHSTSAVQVRDWWSRGGVEEDGISLVVDDGLSTSQKAVLMELQDGEKRDGKGVAELDAILASAVAGLETYDESD
ncbi:hypothetical protein IAU59_007572 [Kwoniella sp. CBS 9459]